MRNNQIVICGKSFMYTYGLGSFFFFVPLIHSFNKATLLCTIYIDTVRRV